MEMLERSDLILSITKKRYEMFKTAEERGIKNKETVKRSKELDVLINSYQRLLMTTTEAGS